MFLLSLLTGLSSALRGLCLSSVRHIICVLSSYTLYILASVLLILFQTSIVLVLAMEISFYLLLTVNQSG